MNDFVQALTLYLCKLSVRSYQRRQLPVPNATSLPLLPAPRTPTSYLQQARVIECFLPADGTLIIFDCAALIRCQQFYFLHSYISIKYIMYTIYDIQTYISLRFIPSQRKWSAKRCGKKVENNKRERTLPCGKSVYRG